VFIHVLLYCTPHETLLGTQRVSNPANRKDLAARTWGVFWYSKIPVLLGVMVQIKPKRGIGVKHPPPRSIWCGLLSLFIHVLLYCTDSSFTA